MAKASTISIKMESTADTGYYYVTKIRELKLKNLHCENTIR